MGFFDDLGGAIQDVAEATVDVVTLGQSDKIKDALTSDLVKDSVLGMSGLTLLERYQESKAKDKALEAQIKADQLTIKEKQEALREVQFIRETGQQQEAEQLAQRELIRQQQQLGLQDKQLQQSQRQTAAESQRLQASLTNVGAQRGASSVLQGTKSSIGTQAALSQDILGTQRGIVGSLQEDIVADQARLSETLEGNLEFLQTTFDLGSDISEASFSLQQASQKLADRQAERANIIGGLGQGAQLAALVPGVGLGGVAVGAILGGGIGAGLLDF